MKLHLPKRRRYRIYLYLLSILIILIALDLLLVRIGRQITISPNTTYITSPLNPDGTPNYLQAIDNSARIGITPDNNAALLLVQLFPIDDTTPPERDEIFARLHFSAPSAYPHAIQKYEHFLRARYVSETTLNTHADEAEELSTQLWDAATHPDLAAWIDANTETLTLLQQAVQRPRYYLPYFTLSDRPLVDTPHLPGVNSCRSLTYAACARAMFRAHAGNIEGARTDILTIHHLARLVAQGQYLIEGLSGIALDRTATEATIALAQSPLLNSTQAREFLADLFSLPPFPSLDAGLKTERESVLDILVYASRRGPSNAINTFIETSDSPLFRRAFNYVPIDINAALRETNEFFDRTIAADHAPTFPQRLALNHDVEQDLMNLNRSALYGLFSPGHKIMSMFIPSLTNVPKLPDLQTTRIHLAELALALSAYHTDHQAYPSTLVALSPDYLPSIPKDLFINQPLHYTLTPTGYTLYSVGPNMHDDAGQTRQHHDPAHPHADDLTVTVP